MQRLKRIFWGFVVPILIAQLVTLILTVTLFRPDKDSIIPVFGFISTYSTFSYIIVHIIISFFLKSNLPTIILSYGLSYLTVGQLFKIQHYPGASILTYFGLGLATLGAVLILFLYRHSRWSQD